MRLYFDAVLPIVVVAEYFAVDNEVDNFLFLGAYPFVKKINIRIQAAV